MIKQDCLFDKIHLKNQQITTYNLKTLLSNLYNNVCFSTFPYLVYKANSSKESIERYNSGNCIAFAYFIQMYLKKNHKIDSYLIGASVPELFKVPGTPEVCHCAVLIPINLYEFYILDGALYFVEPMFCSLKNNVVRCIKNSNCHNHENTEVEYHIESCGDTVIDMSYKQILPEKSLCVCCNFVDLPEQKWKYYLSEIKNPDQTIGHSFLLHKPEPFLMFTRFEDNIVKMKYKVQYEDGNIVIRKYPERTLIYKGNTYDNNDTLISLFQELYPYFDDFII